MGSHTHANGGALTLPAHTQCRHVGAGRVPYAHGYSITANVDANVWSGMLGVIAAACIPAAAAGTVAAPGFGVLGAGVAGAAIGNFINNAVNPDADFMDLTLSPHLFHHGPGDSNNQRELRGARAVNMNIGLQPELDHSHAIGTFPANNANWVITLGGTGSA